MACLSSGGPNGELLLLCFAVGRAVEPQLVCALRATPMEDPITIDTETQRVLSGTLTVAKQLGHGVHL